VKTDKDWEARARELSIAPDVKHVYHLEPWTSVERALQLGREMADERAEEIARAIDQTNPRARDRSIEEHMAEIARSTITKPKEPLMWTMNDLMREPAKDEAAIRADEREKIAQQIDGELYDDSRRETATQALCRLRNQLRGEPKTRVQVLEEALRYYANRHATASNPWAGETAAGAVARNALEWKP